MIILAWFLLFVIFLIALSYCRAKLFMWSVSLAVYLLLLTAISHTHPVMLAVFWLIYLAIFVPLNVPVLRRWLVSRHVFRLYRHLMPSMSDTEKAALETGTVGWEGDIFAGKLDWKKLHAYAPMSLSAEEQEFIEGPVAELCRMANDWEITQEHFNLPPEMWQFIKDNGFFAMIIPKKYGGKEFSVAAHAEVISILGGVSTSLASVVSVPNSLGPAELLLEYGTDAQKEHYLPRLARGEELPCFALTSPYAGSDASSMLDYGIVCEQEFEGKKVMGIRLNWDKRYITLAPVATVLGLAFRLFDTDHLLGDQTELGITCALIPVLTKGITIGRRHFPLNLAFPNGPTQGNDVFIPLDYIIGGKAMIGQGWRMLVECLSVGRAVSLPSVSVGGAKLAAFASGAYARIRRQFGVAVGKFEGVQEALARIAGHTYMAEALRSFVIASADNGAEPAVPSAISKYHCTELARKVINDAMDIHGGKGICMGPNNYLARGYQGTPIGITVEGANILTRSMIIFGQGMVRCHPYVLKEMRAAQETDFAKGLRKFDKAFFAHVGFVMSNKVRASCMSLTNARFVTVGKGPLRRYYQHLQRLSAAFSLLVDVSMLVYGGSLKRKEFISARLGDVLSMIYMTSTVLKRFHEQDKPADDLPLLDYVCQLTLYHAEQSINEVLRNYASRWIAALLRSIIFPWGCRLRQPSDKLKHQVASLFLEPSATRERLTGDVFKEECENSPIGTLAAAFEAVIATEDIEKTVQRAVKQGEIQGVSVDEQITAAVAAGIISSTDAEALKAAETLRQAVIAVDDFEM